MKFKTSLLCGSIIATIIFVTIAVVCQYSRFSSSLTINLDPISNLSQTYNSITSLNWNYSIVDTRDEYVDTSLVIEPEKIKAPPKVNFSNKIASGKTGQNLNTKRDIPPYKSVIENFKMNLDDDTDEVVLSSSSIDKSSDEIYTQSALQSKYEEINNSEVILEKNPSFDIPRSLDITRLQEKLATVFETLKAEEVAASNQPSKEEKNDPTIIVAKEILPTVEKPIEQNLQSLEKTSDRVTTQASKNITKPQITGDFETIEDIQVAANEEVTNEYPKKSLTPDVPAPSTPSTYSDKVVSPGKETAVSLEQVDDFYVLDYSKKNSQISASPKMNTQNLPEKEIVSKRVEDVIQREMATGPETGSQKDSEPILAYNSKGGNGEGQSNQKAEPGDNKGDNQSADPLPSSTDTKSLNDQDDNPGSNIILKVRDARFGKGLRGNLSNFELSTLHNHQDSLYDENEGKIEIMKELNSEQSILSGTIVKSEYIRTRVDLLLERGDVETNIPLFQINHFAKFLDRNNANVPGSFILVELNESIEDVQLENETEKYFFLNDKLEIVERADAMYLLIAGVEPGNVLIKYLINDQIAQKIIYVDENELYFDNPEFDRGSLDTFDFFEEGLLSKNEKPLDIPNNQIRYFNFPSVSQRESLLTYSIKTPFVVIGNRKYLEFNHLNQPIYLGYTNPSKQIIPSQDLVNHIINSFGLNDLENSCLLQINLNNHPSEIFYSGHSAAGQLGLEVKYLDREGNLSMDIAETAEKIFINGDRAGTINLEIKYVDGTADYLHSVCANKAYIIEQL